MIIDIIVILKFYLIFLFNIRGVRIRYPCLNTDNFHRKPYVIIRTPHIPIDKLYINDEPIR